MPDRSCAAVCAYAAALQASLKDFMLITMADMRAPLQVVQAASQLLAQQPCVAGDDDGAFLVAAIASACRMLSGIVANVLSLRSLEAGDCAIVAARFSLRGVVAGVLSVCRMSLAHRAGGAASIRWANEADALPHTVLGDGDRLSQILLNLLTNATKFADGSEITVSTCCDAAADAAAGPDALCLTLVVADGGRGMTAEECSRAFEPYARAPTHKGGGTGLGLHICKRFAEAMGGGITVDTAPGRGARFVVSIPVRRVADADGASAEAAALKEAPAAPVAARDAVVDAAARDAVVEAAPRVALDPAPAVPLQAEVAATGQQPRRCRVLLVGACMPTCVLHADMLR